MYDHKVQNVDFFVNANGDRARCRHDISGLDQDNHRTVAGRDGTAATGAETGYFRYEVNGAVIA